MTEQQMREQIAAAIDIASESGDIDVDFTQTYEEAGIMTRNEGIVITAADGSVFQMTIVRAS